MADAVIVSALRSPIGRLGGALSSLSATQLGSDVIRAVLADCELDPAQVDDVIIGQVLQAGAGQNPARQSAMGAGVPREVPAMTVNQVCGGGQRSLHLAAQAIRAGDAEIVVAGGQDSMSNAPHLLRGIRKGIKVGGTELEDSMLTDGLIDAFNHVHMGVTAERLARQHQVTREDQDNYALRSQHRTSAAASAGLFDRELVSVSVEERGIVRAVTADEHPRPGTSLAQLAMLPPLFAEDGSVTAGNSSGLNDGAAAAIVMSAARAESEGHSPLARIASYASAGVDPMLMGMGPVFAARLALKRAGWTADEVDLIEVNEAFAAQTLAVNREMGWDPERVNVNGGAIALGHPLAGSGARIVVTLLHEMVRRDVRRGLASMCIGGGQGVAICLER